jgi:hypothetical protein
MDIASPAPADVRKPALILFTRYPIPGRSKTRLIPALGPQGAALLQALMTEQAAAWAGVLARAGAVDFMVAYEGADEASMRAWLGGGAHYRPQAYGDLGRRMSRALGQALEDGAPAAVLVGSDLPGLGPEQVRRALLALEHYPLVIGPSLDGGYHLVGVRGQVPDIFQGIAWGIGQVLAQTLERASELGVRYHLLPALGDVDHPQDLPLWLANRRAIPGMISVVIPALNEAGRVGRAVASAGDRAEVIVVDGGSDDATADQARAAGALVISAARGRARQMNAGAALARGEHLVFLHADTVLPTGWEAEVPRLLSRPGVAAGAFRFQVDRRLRGMGLIEATVQWRSARLGMPYGDQAIFLRSDTFGRVGGYADIPLMEDVALMRALRPLGRVAVSPLAAISSARRWEELGVLRTTLANWTMATAYLAGLDLRTIERLYHCPPRWLRRG